MDMSWFFPLQFHWAYSWLTYNSAVGFYSRAFLVFLTKESKKRRRKQLGKLMSKSYSQPVNLPSAQPLMNLLFWVLIFTGLLKHSYISDYDSNSLVKTSHKRKDFWAIACTVPLKSTLPHCRMIELTGMHGKLKNWFSIHWLQRLGWCQDYSHLVLFSFCLVLF